MGSIFRIFFTYLMGLALLSGIPSGARAVQVESNQSWGNFRTLLQAPKEEGEEPEATAGFNENLELTEMEIVDCDPPSGATNRNCFLRNIQVQLVGAHFQNYMEPSGGTWINGKQLKLNLTCEADYCIFANPTLINCTTLAAQAKNTGEKLEIKMSLESGSSADNLIQQMQNGTTATLSLGKSPLQSMACMLQ